MPLRLPTAIALAMLLAGCVTINIYFPAAAAEKAADKLIDEIWQLKDGKPTSSGQPAAEPGTPGAPKP